jgi:membrane fusion protein, heavy metal efflux system
MQMVTPMLSHRRILEPKRVGLVLLALLAVGCLAAFAIPPVRQAMQHWLAAPGAPAEAAANGHVHKPLELIEDAQGHDGLRVSAEAIANLELHPVAAEPAVRARPLPPQPGELKFDQGGMHMVRPRFQGELVELAQVADSGHPPYGPDAKRPIRSGDVVKQGQVLAVLWCKDLGEKKAALIDAIQNLRLSKDTLERRQKLAAEGTISEQSLKDSIRQFQIDENAVKTAERTLLIWKLSEKDIADIKKEANDILDKKKPHDLKEEIQRWARVEVPVPVFKDDPQKDFVILEMNTNVNDFVDPGRDTPMFRLGNMSRLQIWVHIPGEYLPLLQAHLKKHGPGSLRWQIRFQAESNQPPLDLPILQILPSLEPNQKTPTLIGYLDNPDGRYLVGQFVTATIFVPPPEDTVEIPTEAVNQYEGQNYVFVQNPLKKDEFFMRRVVVASNSGGTALVRSKLTAEDEKMSQLEKAKGHRGFAPLLPGERVITKGVVELTSALDELWTNREAEKLQQAAPEQGR